MNAPLGPRGLARQAWATDLRDAGRMTRFRIKLLRLAVTLAREFGEHELSLRATGLVYATLLSLVPFLAVAFSVLKAFGVHLAMAPVLDGFLAPLGPAATQVTATLVSFVDNVRVGVLGAVGIAGLFITVVTLVQKVEDAFNHIWRIRQPRSLARQFSDYLSVVLVGPVLIFTALGLIASAQSHPVVQRIMQLPVVGTLMVVGMAHVMPFLFLCGAFTFLYRLVPHTHVRLKSAMVGGATAALLWQVAGVAFTAFIAGSKQYSAIYSGFAIIVVFLLWLYYSWLVVLVGADVAYLHQHPFAFLALPRATSQVLMERAALATMVEVARRHAAGEPPATVDGLAARFSIAPTILEELIRALIGRGLLLRAAEPPGLALGRAAEQIPILEIIDAVRLPEEIDAAPADERLGVADRILQHRDEAVRQVLGGETLGSLLSDTAAVGAPAVRLTEPAVTRRAGAA